MLRIKQQVASSAGSNEVVSLKQVRVDAKLRSFAADVTLTQVFQNAESVAVEAVYCFPVEENAAIYAFVARIDDEREIVAELKEKKTAQREYTQALAEGHSAYLLEQDEASNDIFIVNVGALQPGSQCQITISYVSELDLLHSNKKPTIRFTVPTTIAPRYSPAHKGISSPGGTQVEYTESVPYTIEFTCQVEKLGQDVACISSPSHPIKIAISNKELFLVTFTKQGIALDRDIIVDVQLSKVRKSTIAAIDNGAAMVSFIPTEQDCRQGANNGTNEFLFVIDCSGSMDGGGKIGLARKAMLLFLKSLPVGCRFNIIRFGSSFSALFTDQVTREYDETNMRQTEKMIKDMRADLGGTELLQPLHWLKNNAPSSGCVRQIFLLTDGEVSNVSEVTNLCAGMATNTRIFSFGLGHSPSRALVKGLARATNGYYAFIAPHTNVDVYVAEQLARALQPTIADVHVKWNTSQHILHKVPERAPPVFVGDRLLFYALLDETMPFDHSTAIELYTDVNQHPIGMARIDCVPPVLGSQTITRLAAKAFLREQSNDQGSIDRDHLVKLSVKYGILCPQTAFVAVETRLGDNNESNIDMKLREIPIMIRKTCRDSVASFRTSSSTSLQTRQSLLCDMSTEDIMLKRRSNLSIIESRFDSLNISSHRACLPPLKSKKSSASTDSILKPAVDFVSSLFNKQSTKKSAASSYSKPATYSTCDITPQSKSSNSQVSKTGWPTDEQNLFDRFIELLQYDGLWLLTADDVIQLTGKPLNTFSSSISESVEKNHQQVIITTAIALVVLETRCLSMKTLWQALSDKAYKRLKELLGGEETKLEQLMKDVRDQFQ